MITEAEENEYILNVIKYTSQKIGRLMFSKEYDQVFAEKIHGGYKISINCNTFLRINLDLAITSVIMEMPEGHKIYTVNQKRLDLITSNLQSTGNFRSFITAMHLLIERSKLYGSVPPKINQTQKTKRMEELQSKIDLAISMAEKKRIEKEMERERVIRILNKIMK